MKGPCRRGFSLAEMLMAVSLLGLLVVASLGARTRRSGDETRLAAEAVAAHLKAASARARASGQVVALAFPPPCADGLVLLEGTSEAHLRRVLRFGREFPNVRWAAGQYAGPTWTASSWPLSDWAGTWNQHAVYAFLPSGECVSNQRQTSGGYRLVVANGLTISGRGEVQQAYGPYTLFLSGRGQVAVQAGLPEAAAGVVSATPLGRPDPGALPAWQATENQPPRLARPAWRSDPPAVGGTLYVQPGQLLSLEVQAEDPDGDDLFCHWTCSSGTLSEFERSPMHWDEQKHLWLGRVTWKAPGQPASDLSLDCRVEDGRGGEIRLAEAVRFPPLEVRRQPRVMFAVSGALSRASNTMPFVSNSEEETAGMDELMSLAGQAAPNHSLWVSNLDGSDETLVANGVQLDGLSLMPDRKALFFDSSALQEVDLKSGALQPVLNRDPQKPIFRICADPLGRGSYQLLQDGSELLLQHVLRGNRGTGVVRRSLRFAPLDQYAQSRAEATLNGLVSVNYGVPQQLLVGPDNRFLVLDKDAANPSLRARDYVCIEWTGRITPITNFPAGQHGTMVCSAKGYEWVCWDSDTITRTPMNYNSNTYTLEPGASTSMPLNGLQPVGRLRLSRDGRHLSDDDLHIFDWHRRSTLHVPVHRASPGSIVYCEVFQ